MLMPKKLIGPLTLSSGGIVVTTVSRRGAMMATATTTTTIATMTTIVAPMIMATSAMIGRKALEADRTATTCRIA